MLTVFPAKAISRTIPTQPLEFLQPDLIAAQFLYDQQTNHKLAKITSFCSCANFVKSQTGFDKAIGYAKNWPINSEVPEVGAVVITSESWAGHVALITAVSDTAITITEANYVPCQKTNRTLSLNDPRIRGYYIER